MSAFFPTPHQPHYNQVWRWKMDPRALLADIHALEEEILAFERKYGVRSETFYAAYASGEEPEDDRWVLDFGEWASVYRTWLARQAQYRNEMQRRQPNAPSLAGLIHLESELRHTLSEPSHIDGSP